MKKFGFKFIVFSVVAILTIVTSHIILINEVSQNINFNVSSNPKYYIIGHSIPECAYNDSLIKNTKNIASSGEAYFYNYFKLKKVLEQNVKPKAVLIEFTNNQLSKVMNDWTWDDKHISQKYVPFSPLIPIKESTVLLYNNFAGFSNGLALSLKSNLYSIIRDDYLAINEIGGYRKLENKLSELDLKPPKEINQKFKEKSSQVNFKYLKKMIKLCENYSVKVVLIRSPQNPKINNFGNEKLYQKFLREDFQDIRHIDFKIFIKEDSLYADFSHLNYNGAKKISVFLDSIIRSGILNQKKINLKF
jgi:hypothetical protein